MLCALKTRCPYDIVAIHQYKSVIYNLWQKHHHVDTIEIARVSDCYAIEGHSKLLMLVPIENLYVSPISE